MNVTLYQNNSDNIVVNKTINVITGPMKCTVLEPCSIEKPSFILRGSSTGADGNTIDFTRANYCHAIEWGKYYYIDEIVYLDGNRFQYNCHEDVLMTYGGAIKKTSQHVVRQAKNGNLYLNDPEWVTSEKIVFENRPFVMPATNPLNPAINHTDRSYILNTM